MGSKEREWIKQVDLSGLFVIPKLFHKGTCWKNFYTLGNLQRMDEFE
jgi:hypothetical protein